MNVLMVLLHLPSPTIGVSTRNYHVLQALAREHRVSLVVLADDQNPANRSEAARLAPLVQTIRMVAPPHASKRLMQLKHLAQGKSHRVMEATVPAVQEALDDLFSRDPFDAVLFESIIPAGYRLPPGVAVIIDQHNIEHELLRRSAQDEPLGLRKLYNWLESRRLEPIEIERCARADAVLVTSERERQILTDRLPHQVIQVVPNGVDLDYFTRTPATLGEGMGGPPSGEAKVVFTGAMSYFPNVDAVVTFAERSWPLIRREVPDATWDIVGRDPLPAVQRLAGLPGVRVTGAVPDVRPYLASAAVAIAPLHSGSGTRLKILEAFAMGLPVVATPLGCEGLAVVPDRHLLVAESSEDVAAAVVRCLRDARLRSSLAREGRALAEAEYGWDRSGEHLLQVLRLLSARRQPVSPTVSI